MQFNISYRDGPARIGELQVDSQRIVTPSIIFVESQRYTAPPYAEILLTNTSHNSTSTLTIEVGNTRFTTTQQTKHAPLAIDNYLFYPKDLPIKLHSKAILHNHEQNDMICLVPATKDIINLLPKEKNTMLYILTNTEQLFSQQTLFTEYITQLREIVGYQKMLYLPSLADPTNIALLTYLGIDLIDNLHAIYAARNNTLLFTTGAQHTTTLTELSCYCPTCSTATNSESLSTQDIYTHNNYMFISEIKKVRNAIRQGNLRELVEIRVRAHPTLAAILRLLDKNHYTYLEQRTPIHRKQQLIATTKDSLHRPEIKRFQERIINRYTKPTSKKILVVLPCSKRKPYSFSPSHRLFHEVIHGCPNSWIVHELIVTSPLGIVPRELELTYPASAYDITVTGHWDEDEKQMIRTLLQQYLEKNTYDHVILHVSPKLQSFINDVFNNPVCSCITTPTDAESLQALAAILQKLTSDYPRVSRSTHDLETLQCISLYQFDKSNTTKLFFKCNSKGKYPYTKFVVDGKQLGMLTQERGLLSLTIEGAKRIQDSDTYWVEIADDFVLKGSVFTPGIRDADPLIRVGDEVIIRCNQRLVGVGVATMNGKEMVMLAKGEAVKVRHTL